MWDPIVFIKEIIYYREIFNCIQSILLKQNINSVTYVKLPFHHCLKSRLNQLLSTFDIKSAWCDFATVCSLD